MNLRNLMLFWAACAAVLLGFVWLFDAVLLPFIVGIIIAYLLNPLVVALGKYNLSRTLATLLILTLFVLVCIGFFLLVIPPLYQQLLQLADAAPGYVDALWARLEPYFASMQNQVSTEEINQNLREVLRNNVSNAFNLSSSLLGGLLSGGMALVSLFSLLVITPLVAFFMMIEWPALVKWSEDLMPRGSLDQTRQLFKEIDRKIAGFIRGQLLVAIALAILYALALTIAGLQFGFLIGLGAGVLSIIPLFGSIVGLLVSVGVAWFQSGELVYTLVIAGIFIVGQILEGNVITPKLVGKSVGLHPLWILFSLLAGGALLGVVGMMLAVPLAATVGVLSRFAIEQYKASSYYDS